MNKHFSTPAANLSNDGKADNTMNVLNRESISRFKRKPCGFTLIELLVMSAC